MLPLLDALHADPTRFVTRSVANHLNDIAKIAPERVLAPLADWKARGAAGREGTGVDDETRATHAGQSRGIRARWRRWATIPTRRSRWCPSRSTPTRPGIGGTAQVKVALTAPETCPVLVDYIIWFRRPAARKRQGAQAEDRRPSRPGRP
jgi:hypothetical protein